LSADDERYAGLAIFRVHHVFEPVLQTTSAQVLPVVEEEGHLLTLLKICDQLVVQLFQHRKL
jgi:hypothetical protein